MVGSTYTHKQLSCREGKIVNDSEWMRHLSYITLPNSQGSLWTRGRKIVRTIGGGLLHGYSIF